MGLSPHAEIDAHTGEEPSVSDDLLSNYARLPHEPEPHEPSLVRGTEHLPRLEIRDADGTSRTLPYASLQYIHFRPGDHITLTFWACEVELKGENLKSLFDALNTQSVKTILVRPDELARGPIVRSCHVEPAR